MRVALVTFNAQDRDAIGNQVAEKVVFFIERGADVRVFVESDARIHPAVQHYCHVAIGEEPDEAAWSYLSRADLVVVEYGHFYGLLHWLPLLAGGRARVL